MQVKHTANNQIVLLTSVYFYLSATHHNCTLGLCSCRFSQYVPNGTTHTPPLVGNAQFPLELCTQPRTGFTYHQWKVKS